MNKNNLLIIEDHTLTRFGLKTAFENNKIVSKIFEASDAESGIAIVAKESVDVILMDLGLPEIDGLEATRIIKSKHPKIKVIILSSHEKQEDVINSIKSGASAYCTKDVAPEKLTQIVESVLQGASWFDPKVAQYVLNAAKENNEDNLVLSPVNDFKLTAREIEVLKLIAQGLTNTEIAKSLKLSINTIKVHVCNILQKMSVNDRTQAAIKALKDKII